jgi:hypothetical protein
MHETLFFNCEPIFWWCPAMRAVHGLRAGEFTTENTESTELPRNRPGTWHSCWSERPLIHRAHPVPLPDLGLNSTEQVSPSSNDDQMDGLKEEAAGLRTHSGHLRSQASLPPGAPSVLSVVSVVCPVHFCAAGRTSPMIRAPARWLAAGWG